MNGIIKSVGGIIGLLLCAVVNANVVQPLSGQNVRYLPNQIAGEDFIYVNPPNAAGISVNRFSALELDSPIKLMNTPSYEAATDAPVASSRLVVIISPNITLSSVIDIVGPATDILFITDSASGGTINCNSCIVNNALRLTMAAADATSLSSGVSNVGSVITKGVVTVNSLFAPGAVGLDLVAERVVSSGEININQSAIKSGAGGYSVMPGGNYSIGTGGIDVLSGGAEWDYEARQINAVIDGGSSQYAIGGVYKAPRIYISSSHHLQFSGRIDTRVSAISAVSYRGQTHVPQESVALQALSNGAGGGVNVAISGDIYSDNTIDIRATRDINVQGSSKIVAGGVKLLAGRTILNKGSIGGGVVSMAGDEVLNEGLVDANTEAELWAEFDLANQYGGVIRAPVVKLQSESSVVRNGSRTPYRTTSTGRNNFLLLNNSEILSSLDGLLDFDAASVNSADLGTFYLLPGSLLLVNDGSVSMAEDHSAHIIGNDVFVKATAFENINPYYEGVTNQSSVLLDRERISQVSVSAENLLEIQGADGSESERADYVVNSSALMTVNSPAGRLRVQSYRFINQRYRISTFFVPLSSSSTEDPDSVYVTSVSVRGSGYGSSTRVYSPPGFLGVMGHMEMNASQYFANIMGYVEVFSGADISSVKLKNIGLENQGVLRETTTTKTVFDRNYYGSQSSSTIAKDPTELDSLFNVAGELNASDADAWFGVLNPFNYFLTEAVQARSNDIFPLITHHLRVYNESGCEATRPGCESRVFERETLQVEVDPEEVLASISRDQIAFDYSVSIERKFGGYYGEGPSKYTTATGTESLSLMETLEKYYGIVRTKISEWVAEFNWWGLAE